jgi:hypothetical protein
MTDHEKWLNRFANLWLACEKDRDLVQDLEPIEEKLGRLIGEELNAGISKENINEQEEWLMNFANLWLTSKMEREPNLSSEFDTHISRVPKLEAPSNDNQVKTLHSTGVLAELGKGRVVIGDSYPNLNDQPGEKEELSLGFEDSKLNPDDLIIFDIDPEMAIKLFKASKGVSS